MHDLICSWQNSILLRSLSSVAALLECLPSSSKTASAALHTHPQKYCYLGAERLWITVRNRALPPWEHSSRGSKMLKLLTAFPQRFKHQQIRPWRHIKAGMNLTPLSPVQLLQGSPRYVLLKVDSVSAWCSSEESALRCLGRWTTRRSILKVN